MPVQAEVRIIRGRTLPRRLRQLRKDLEDRVEAHRAAGQLQVQRIIQNVRAGRGPDGNQLRPLSQSTLDDRRRRGVGGTTPLIDTGQMINSLRVFVRQTTRESITEIRPTGRQVVKAAAHQQGLGVPARPWLGINTTEVREHRRIFVDDMRVKAKKASRGA